MLTQLYALARRSANGADVGEFQLRDRTGGLLEHAEHAWIKKAPANAYGKEAGEREWELAVADLVREVEG
jgi:hypothetical protein